MHRTREEVVADNVVTVTSKQVRRNSPRKVSIVLVGVLSSGVGWAATSMAQQGDQRSETRSEEMARAADAPSVREQSSATFDEISAALRLTLRFLEYPGLSGEYRVNADGTIAVPVIGRFQVSGTDTQQLEAAITKKLAELTGRESPVSVDVAEFRHVYVTGYINSPGSTQWRPGMTVLHAVTTAGGLYRAGTAGGSDLRDSARVRKLVDDQKRALATLARREAEQAESDTIEVLPQLVSLVGRREAEILIQAQTSLFVSRRSALENQLAMIERGRSFASRELEGLKLQNESINAQLKLRRDASRKTKDLQARGLAVAERSLEQEIRVSELEEKSIAIAVAVARIQSTVAGFDRDAAASKHARRNEIEADLLKAEREVAQNAIELEALTGQQVESTENHSGEPASIRVSYSITRGQGELARVVPGEESTLLVPGDVLAVTPLIR